MSAVATGPRGLQTRQEREHACPSCSGGPLLTFYVVRNVPVHNALVVDTRREALDFPRGDLSLAYCTTCGFITNIDFDPALLAYGARYEEQQTFSPTFDRFANRLAKDLIDTHALRDKLVVEIGCGKGDFLAALCELGNNTGIGIDPSIVPQRLNGRGNGRMTLIADFYSQRYAGYQADLLCCRHTLEHIHNPDEFLGTIRAAIGDRTNTVIFFELPDVLRVLREQAYWDIYYEHCSYFSQGSLARLFRRHGFEVTRNSLVYDDQYIVLDARPVDARSEEESPEEESVDVMAEAVAKFSADVGATVWHWKSHLYEMRQQGKRVVVWGSGSKAVSFLTTTCAEREIEFVVDINPHRQGKFILGAGKEIMPPEFLKAYRPDEIVVMNAIYVPEIQKQLDELGVKTHVVAV